MKIDREKLEEFRRSWDDKDLVSTLDKICPQVQTASGQHIHVILGARNTCSQLLEEIGKGNVQSTTWGEFKIEREGFYQRCSLLLYKAFDKGIYTL